MQRKGLEGLVVAENSVDEAVVELAEVPEVLQVVAVDYADVGPVAAELLASVRLERAKILFAAGPLPGSRYWVQSHYHLSKSFGEADLVQPRR